MNADGNAKPKLSKSQQRRARAKAAKSRTQQQVVAPPKPPKPKNLGRARGKGDQRTVQPTFNNLTRAWAKFDQLEEFELVAVAFINPKAAPSIRWSSQYNSDKTGCTNPWIIVPVGWNNSATPNTTTIVPNTDTVACVFRCAERAIIFTDANTAGSSMNYGLYGCEIDSSENLPVPASSWIVLIDAGQVSLLHAPYALSQLSYSPHGPMLFAGSPGSDQRFLWVDFSSQVIIAYSTTSSQVPHFPISYWMDGEEELVYNIVQGSTGLLQTATLKTANVDPAGYYSFSVTSTTGGAFVINAMTISNVSGGPVTCHRPLPYYDVECKNVEAIRLYAASLKYTNQAGPLNRQGKVAQWQVPQGTPWGTLITPSGAFSAISGSQGSETISVEHGAYQYLKITQPSDMDMKTWVTTRNGVVVDSYYPLLPDTAFICTYVQVTPTAGQDGYWTFAFGIEFRSDHTWFENKVSTFSEEACSKAMSMLKRAPQYMENESHLSTLFSWLKKAGVTVLKAGAKAGVDAIRDALNN